MSIEYTWGSFIVNQLEDGSISSIEVEYIGTDGTYNSSIVKALAIAAEGFSDVTAENITREKCIMIGEQVVERDGWQIIIDDDIQQQIAKASKIVL